MDIIDFAKSALANPINEEPKKSPVVNDGATIQSGSDRYAGTIIEVSEKRVVVQEDAAQRTDDNGISESQTYNYARNSSGHVWTFHLDRKGLWREVTQDQKTKRWKFIRQWQTVIFGVREKHYDFSK